MHILFFFRIFDCNFMSLGIKNKSVSLKDNFMEELETKNQEQPKQTIIIQQPVSRSNGLGTAGFVLALIALFLGWIPFLGWIVWLLGLIFSACGMFKAPRGLAIAGLVISLIGVILLLAVFGAVTAALTL